MLIFSGGYAGTCCREASARLPREPLKGFSTVEVVPGDTSCSAKRALACGEKPSVRLEVAVMMAFLLFGM